MVIKVNLTADGIVNFAACHSSTEIIKKLTLVSDVPANVILRVYGKPEFVFEVKQTLSLKAGKTHTIKDLHLTLNDEFFRTETLEAREGNLNIEILDAEDNSNILGFAQQTVEIQPYLHWRCGTETRELAHFMQPNDPLVANVIKRVGELASQEGGVLCGYGCSVPNQARWLFQALKEEKLHYNYPPVGWEARGQKVRIPHMILQENCRQGTCLDLAILYCSCLEALSLHPILFIIYGHAFAGVWTEENAHLSLSGSSSNLTDILADKRILPVECTLYADYSDTDFASAAACGWNNLRKCKLFYYALDLCVCHKNGFTPAFTFTDKPICTPPVPEVPLSFSSKDAMAPSVRRLTKLDQLKDQAMNLSLTNVLLKLGKKAEHPFAINTAAFLGGQYTPIQLYSAFCSGTNLTKKSRSTFLYTLRSTARQAKRDTGTNIVWLALDRLKWVPDGSEDPAEAPLFLCPVSIEYNLRGELIFLADPKDTQLNPVLREYLMQKYNMDISALNECGEDDYTDKTALLRDIISGHPDWSVIPSTAFLLSCTMPNEAIYQGLNSEKLMENPIVNGILTGAMTWDNDLDGAADSGIYAFPADSSQAKVIAVADTKRCQVIFGPAGNGKSQTIANIIVRQIENGHRVLFVTEKPSAQEVIYDKLAEIGLDAFCLMLPDGKNKVSVIADKLEAALAAADRISVETGFLPGISEKGKNAADMLEIYYKLLSHGRNGYSLRELLKKAAALKDAGNQFDRLTCNEALAAENSEKLFSDYVTAFSALNSTDVAYLSYLKALDTEEADRAVLADRVKRYTVLSEKVKALQSRCNSTLGIAPVSSGLAAVDRAQTYASELLRCPIVGNDILDPDEQLRLERIAVVSANMARIGMFNQRYPELEKELQELRGGHGTIPGLGGVPALYDVKKIPIYAGPDGVYSAEQKARIEKAKSFGEYQLALASLLDGRPDSERSAVLRASYAIARGEGAALTSLFSEYIAIASDAHALSVGLADAVTCNLPAFETEFPGQSVDILYSKWLMLNEQNAEANTCQKAFEAGKEAGLEDAFRVFRGEILNNGAIVDELIRAFEKTAVSRRISAMLESPDGIPDYIAQAIATSAEDYAAADTAMRECYRKAVLAKLADSLPKLKEGVANDPELGALQRIIRNSGAGIRSAFAEAGGTLQKFFPIMIMGAGSAAEYLPEEMSPFDLVIFDEGSQLSTYKALIPIARANRCIVVGDEKQLTPTSFFEKAIENDDGSTSKRESILEDAIICSMPQNMLRFHYRSCYEDLIAFPNRYYYNGRIVSFPVPELNAHGIEYIYAEDGIYDRGETRTNEKEAARVLALAEQLCSERTDKSIGIITFNLNQMQLIRGMISDKISEGASNRLAELVDVVNLESCQGKEWDITILSPAYGPDQNGEFSTNLGPFSQEGGRNRLNVLITRSKEKLYLVTSMTAEMFGDDPTGALADLRDFILFAQGRLSLNDFPAKAETGSDTADMIANVLRSEGYQVQTHLGFSSCKIDVAVVAPDGNSYCLGILLDPEPGTEMIDHELIIPSVLKSRGWNLLRLHDINWYTNAPKELEAIKTLLKG